LHMLVTPISNAMVNRLILGQNINNLWTHFYRARCSTSAIGLRLIKEGRLADFGIDLEGSAYLFTQPLVMRELAQHPVTSWK